MTLLHRVTIALICSAMALALLNAVLLFNRPSPAPTADEQNLSGWQRWQALEPARRVACVQCYQAINRRADARDTWRHAREFGRLPPAEQDRLRQVLAVLHETLDRQPPVRRRELWRAPARIRAYEAYRILREEDPGRVQRLRSAWATTP